MWAETTLDVVVDSQIPLNHIIKISDDLIRILIKKSLQLGHLLIVIKVFLILSIQLYEDGIVMLQSFDQLLGSSLLSECGCLPKLIVLLLKSIVEGGQLDLGILLNVTLLILNDLMNLVLEL